MRFLILGAGAVTTEYYLPAMEMMGRLGDVLIVDPSPQAIKGVINKFAHVQYRQAGFLEFLSDISAKDVSTAVIVALPNSLHKPAVELALSKGFDCLCEKPLALSENDCLELGRRADAAGKILAVGMVRRLLPSHVGLSESLSSGLIGALKEIEIEDGEPYAWISDTGDFFKKENGGVLTDMGTHYLDYARQFLGALTPVSYEDDYKGGVEANCLLKLVSSAGVPVSIKLSRTHRLANKIVFKGECGELTAAKDVFRYCLWLTPRLKNVSVKIYPKKPSSIRECPVNLVPCFADQLNWFESSVHERRCSLATAIDAADTMRLVEWAYRNRQTTKAGDSSSCGFLAARSHLSEQKVVVTGGTGFIGSHLVPRLYREGFSRITVPVRRYGTCARVAVFPVNLTRVNLLDYQAVMKAFNGARFVFHLAYGRDGIDTSRVTVEGTRNVVNAAVQCGAESVVILSSMYVFGHPDTDVLVDESWPYCPAGGGYGRDKVRMERWCKKRAKSSNGTRITILNPSCVYGPLGDVYTRMPVDMARQRKFCLINDGIGIANYTFIDNLVDAIMLAARRREAHGENLIINDGFCSWKEFLSQLLGELADSLPSYDKKKLSAMGRVSKAKIGDIIAYLAGDLEFMDMVNRNPCLGAIKRFALKFLPGLRPGLIQRRAMQKHYPPIELQRPAPPVWLADLFGPTRTKFSADKAKRIIGWNPAVTLIEGLRITRDWLSADGYSAINEGRKAE